MEKSIRIAYKKLKSSVYFDKTQLCLLNRIVDFESASIEAKLDRLAGALTSANEAAWQSYKDEILDNIGVLVFPKTREVSNRNMLVFNGDSSLIQLRDVHHYIDLPVEGHILGTLWCMAARTTSDGRTGYVPDLFDPYYLQYENWRNKAIESAQKKMDNSHDAIILTFDFQSFYYNLDIQLQDFKSFFREEEKYDKWQKRLNGFVFDVICHYSNRLRQVLPSPEQMVGERNVLPFGFLPSYILSKMVLSRLDEIVTTRRNPKFYGRFNGNIMVVDEVDTDSPLYEKYVHSEGGLSPSDALEYYFGGCCENGKTTAPLLIAQDNGYKVNSALIDCHSAKITAKSDRINLFYFREGTTQSLINCFHTKFVQTDLDFDYLPLMDNVFLRGDYSELYSIVDEGSQYAPRRVTDATLDREKLYDFLDKYRRISSMITDHEETCFERELLRIFSKAELVDNYFIWERLFEILIINGRTEKLSELTLRIVDCVAELDIPEKLAVKKTVQDSLINVLHAALCRASSIEYSQDLSTCMNKLYEHIRKAPGLVCSPELKKSFSPEKMFNCRLNCCKSRMTNKYLLPLPIDCVLDSLQEWDGSAVRLYRLAEVLTLINVKWPNQNIYHYYPYVVTPQELSFALACTNICSGRCFSDPKLDREALNCMYSDYNYPSFLGIVYTDDSLQKVDVCQLPDNGGFQCFATSVDCEHKDILRVAIGNADIYNADMYAALSGNPNRSYERYSRLCQMLDSAIEEGVDLLVLPECYLPFDWIPTVSRLCASRQIGLVTGVEHVTTLNRSKKTVAGASAYNLTAIILPYKEGGQSFSYVSYHSKVQFSPDEELRIKSQQLTPANGDVYQAFRWHDVWFSVYCCFELASINERALFRSLADITVAVEWNRDVTYFNNIIDSLCRDLHCYCIQANSASYGDSCVIKPAGANHRDIIKTKGGINKAILVGDLDIAALRSFQLQPYDHQLSDKTFKPTPPLFKTETVKMKQNGSLWDALKNDMN